VKKTLLDSLLVGITVAAMLLICGALWAHFGSSQPSVCVAVPKAAALSVANVHGTAGGLYLCFQQGVAGERTETRCVPMTSEQCAQATGAEAR